MQLGYIRYSQYQHHHKYHVTFNNSWEDCTGEDDIKMIEVVSF